MAEPLHDLHHVAGEDHRAAADDIAYQDVADQRPRDRVDRLERLVEHQQARRVQQGAGQADLLLSCRRSSRRRACARRRPGPSTSSSSAARESTTSGGRPRRRPVVRQQPLPWTAGRTPSDKSGRRAQVPLGLDGVGPDVVAEHVGVAARRGAAARPPSTARWSCRRRWVRAARSKPGGYVEIDARHRDLVVEAACEPPSARAEVGSRSVTY